MIKYAYYITDLFPLRVGYDAAAEVVVLLDPADTNRDGGTGERCPLTDRVADEVSEYLAGERREFTFPYELRGTIFQLSVWRELCKIPYGETRSYGEIAAAVGSPRAARAVGRANNRNPIFIAVPCHRVIGADGSLVGYGGGLDVKARLLELERRDSRY